MSFIWLQPWKLQTRASPTMSWLLRDWFPAQNLKLAINCLVLRTLCLCNQWSSRCKGSTCSRSISRWERASFFSSIISCSALNRPSCPFQCPFTNAHLKDGPIHVPLNVLMLLGDWGCWEPINSLKASVVGVTFAPTILLWPMPSIFLGPYSRLWEEVRWGRSCWLRRAWEESLELFEENGPTIFPVI